MEREITLREYGRVLWSGRWVLLATTVAAMVVGLVFALTASTNYTATAKISLGQATTSSGTPLQTAATNPATAPTVLGADRLVVNVAEQLDLTPGEVRNAVHLSAPRTSGGASGNQPTLMIVTWTDSDRERAERGANAYVEQIETFMLEQNAPVMDTLRRNVARAEVDVEQLNKDVTGYREQLGRNPAPDVRITLQTLLNAATTQLSNARNLMADQQILLAKAETSEVPRVISLAESATSSGGVRSIARSVIVAGVIGLLLGIAIVFVWRGSPAGRAGRQD